MRRRTFAVDIDGTITENGGGRIHLGALGALRRLAAAGHDVIFVTGRSSVEAYVLSVFGGTTGVAVGENGGCITTGPSEHRLVGDIGRCRGALAVLQEELDGVAEKPVFPRMTEVVLERTFDIGEAGRIISERGLGVAVSDSRYAYHLNSEGVDKGRGLAEAAGILGAKREDIVAIGDSGTDVPMFAAAGTSVALGNAPEDVRSAADMAAQEPAGPGVIEALGMLGCLPGDGA